jgi:hypothetical protein
MSMLSWEDERVCQCWAGDRESMSMVERGG